MNAKCDVVMKLSVFGTRTDTHTHTRQSLYILAMRAVNIVALMLAIGEEGKIRQRNY